jgi:mRNA interferase MazF
VVQDDHFDQTESITVCPLTTDPTPAYLVRPTIDPDELNGLREPSRVMTDKIMTLPRAKMGRHVGRLDDDEMARLEQAVMVFLGLTSPSTA